MVQLHPVRPPPLHNQGGGGGGDTASTVALEEEEINYEDAYMQDPIVGVETSGHDSPAHIQPRPLASPPEMTKEEKAKHDLTHTPPHPGCAICRSTRTPNLPNSMSHESSRTIPSCGGIGVSFGRLEIQRC